MSTLLNAAQVRVRAVAIYERPVSLRLPFRFGAATVTQCPQAFVRVGLEVGGRTVEGALRASGLGWVDGVTAGLLGDPWTPQITLKKPTNVWLRHTVGLADRIYAGDAGTSPADGLPETLEGAIAHYGLRYFKIKLCGQLDADIDRLGRIASLLADAGGDYRATLDGNETFENVQVLGEFWRALQSHAQTQTQLKDLLARALLLEQPLARKVALSESLVGLGFNVPVILDESDDNADVFEKGLALGYRGISSKACKGIYRSFHSAWRGAQEPRRLLLSGEDLTCEAGLAVQHGQLQLGSLHTPGFASAVFPRWDSLKPIV